MSVFPSAGLPCTQRSLEGLTSLSSANGKLYRQVTTLRDACDFLASANPAANLEEAGMIISRLEEVKVNARGIVWQIKGNRELLKVESVRNLYDLLKKYTGKVSLEGGGEDVCPIDEFKKRSPSATRFGVSEKDRIAGGNSFISAAIKKLNPEIAIEFQAAINTLGRLVVVNNDNLTATPFPTEIKFSLLIELIKDRIEKDPRWQKPTVKNLLDALQIVEKCGSDRHDIVALCGAPLQPLLREIALIGQSVGTLIDAIPARIGRFEASYTQPSTKAAAPSGLEQITTPSCPITPPTEAKALEVSGEGIDLSQDTLEFWQGYLNFFFDEYLAHSVAGNLQAASLRQFMVMYPDEARLNGRTEALDNIAQKFSLPRDALLRQFEYYNLDDRDFNNWMVLAIIIADAVHCSNPLITIEAIQQDPSMLLPSKINNLLEMLYASACL
jgi:hypothetical protein